MENIYWKKTVGTLIGSIWLYTLAGIVGSIVGVVNAIMNPSGVLGMIKDLMEGGSATPQISIGDMVENMFSLFVLAGYYLFFRSLTRFVSLQSDVRDRENLSTVRTAYILMVVALVANFIPLIGWLISFVLMIICYVKMLSGYRGLKKSLTFPAGAREGAAMLYSCTIWTLVGYVLGCIPLLGGVIEGIITIVVFFTILSAWGRIKEAAPDMTQEEEAEFVRNEPPVHVRVLGEGIILFFLIFLMNGLVGFATNFVPMPFSYYSDSEHTFSLYMYILVFDLLPCIFGGALYIWLLCSKNTKLNVWAKMGLGVLILQVIFGTAIDLWFRYIDMMQQHSVYGMLSTASTVVWIIGIMLFIWSTLFCLRIKILFSLCPLLHILYWQFLWRYVMELSEGLQDFTSLILFYTIGWLLIIIVCLILACVFVSQWKKQSIAHANTGFSFVIE